jgi:hypothetical protein
MNEAQSLKPDKRAKKIDSGVFNPPGSQRGCRAEKTEPTREAFWSDDDKDSRPLPVFFSVSFIWIVIFLTCDHPGTRI